jgi:hypothetical protein
MKTQDTIKLHYAALDLLSQIQEEEKALESMVKYNEIGGIEPNWTEEELRDQNVKIEKLRLSYLLLMGKLI